MAKRPPTIPDSELDVLKVLWDRDRATVREALETLRAAGRQWSYATVATLLDRLESKGLVTSDRSELAFVYRPTITAQEVRQKRLSNLVDKLYQGEPGLLVLQLVAAPVWKGVERVWRPGPRVVSAATQAAGRELFRHEWTPGDPLTKGDGLGPVFNARSCAECHRQGGLGGGGPIANNVTVY